MEYESIIVDYLLGVNYKAAPINSNTVIDNITDLLLATKNVRFGARPSIEGLTHIHSIVRNYVNMQKPIPILVPWGSIKANFSSHLDIAEVIALSTLASLNKTVKEYYSPGLDINIRIEDWSGVELFQLESDFNKQASWTYCTNLENLIGIMGLNPKRESKMINKDRFHDVSNNNTESILEYLMDSKELIKENPLKCTELLSYAVLKEKGWRGIISDIQRAHYLSCYERLYTDWNEETMMKRLALYFGGSLARFQLGMVGSNAEWGRNYIQIVFVPPVKGSPEGYNNNYIYYRTIPMNQCRTHHAPWRARGYFNTEDSVLKAKLCTFNQDIELKSNMFFVKGKIPVKVNFVA